MAHPKTPPEEASHSYENPDSGASQGSHGAISHSEVTNGPSEGQEYLTRRARVRGAGDESPGLLPAVLRPRRGSGRDLVLLPFRRERTGADGPSGPSWTPAGIPGRPALLRPRPRRNQTGMQWGSARTAADRSQPTVGRNTAPTARNVGGGRVRLAAQRGAADKGRDLEIRAGTPGVVLRLASRGSWFPQTGDDTRPLPEAAGGVGPGQDPGPEAETRAPAPGRHSRPAWRQAHISSWTTSGGSPGRGTPRRTYPPSSTSQRPASATSWPWDREPMTKTPRDPSEYRELAAFQRTWGRSWPGGHNNGNGGNGHRKPQGAV